MSNPAVISLASKNIQSRHVWLDDNIGETIHIHVDTFRIELTNREFASLCEDICDAVNELVRVPGFDLHKIEPVYFETELSHWLKYLECVKLESVRLRDIICGAWAGFNGIKHLPDSWGVKVLNDEIRSPIQKSRFLHEGQSDQARFESAFRDIKERGYPYNGEYLYLFANNRISDGHHRAAALWKLLGDSEIPVMRLYFSEEFNIPPDHDIHVPWWKKTFAFRLAVKTRNFFRYLMHDQKTLARKIYTNLRDKRNHLREMKRERIKENYLRKNHCVIAEINDIFSRK